MLATKNNLTLLSLMKLISQRMNHTMFTLFLCLFTLTNIVGQVKQKEKVEVDFVSYELISVHDKPLKILISPIAIENDTLIEWNQAIVVEKDVFNFIYDYVKRNDTGIQKDRTNFDGVFRIIAQKDKALTTYIIPRPELSRKFFEELKAQLIKLDQKPENLIQALGDTVRRIQ
jgi:hypothetical protein